MKRNELIIWREKIPDVEKGAFGYISEHWGNDVKCYYLQKPDKERAKVGWEVGSYAKVDVEQINTDVSTNSFVEHVIHTYPNAIHLFGGLRTELQEYIDAYIKLSNGSKFMCIAERPTYVSFPKRLLYRYLSFKYNPYISVFLALGETGVMSYYNLGFRKPVLYPFMYNPLLNINTEFVEIENEEIDNPLKFLYLGRFDYKFKGCDLLMQAFDSIQPMFKSKWSLTLVGGYGDQKDEIISWATTKENVYYTGSWHQNEILKNMSQFDVCVVPSRQDGWNLNPNYSIFSHIGTIVSNEAVSHEIILNSESGLVYDCCDVQMLTKHLEFCIKNREVVIEWKKKAIQFMDRVSSETVGEYFIDIIDYTFYGSEKKPLCPWLIKV